MSAHPVIAIRTHRWGEEEERLLAALRLVSGHDLAVVFHNRPADMVLPLDVIDIDNNWLQAQGFRVVPDWGWRCGDYFFHALRAARPERPFYWLIEPDVFFHGSAEGFFDRFRDQGADALGYRIVPFPQGHAFARGLPGMALFQAVFAMTRLSGRALDRLATLRRAYGAGRVAARFFTNDELFVFSHVAADPELTMATLESVAPDWFDGVGFAPSPDRLEETVVAGTPYGRVLHPVHGRAAFKRALTARIGANTAFLRKHRVDLAALDPADIDEITAMIAARLHNELSAWQAHGGRVQARLTRRQRHLHGSEGAVS